MPHLYSDAVIMAIDEGIFQNIIAIDTASGELFVAFEVSYTFDTNPYTGPYPDPQASLNTTRPAIQVQRWDSDAGTYDSVVWTRNASELIADVSVNPPTAPDHYIKIWGFEVVGEYLYLLYEDKVADDPSDLRTLTIEKRSKSGAIQSSRDIESEFSPSGSTVTPFSLAYGTHDDGSGNPEIVLCCWERARNAGTFDAAALRLLSPSTLGDVTPSDGLGATYSLTSTEYPVTNTQNSLVQGYFDGAGVRWYYKPQFYAEFRAIQGTSGRTEWVAPTNYDHGRIAYTTATATPRAYINNGTSVIVANIDTGSTIRTDTGIGGPILTTRQFSVREIGASSADYFLSPGGGNLRKVTTGPTTQWTTSISAVGSTPGGLPGTPNEADVPYAGPATNVHLPSEVQDEPA